METWNLELAIVLSDNSLDAI